MNKTFVLATTLFSILCGNIYSKGVFGIVSSYTIWGNNKIRVSLDITNPNGTNLSGIQDFVLENGHEGITTKDINTFLSGILTQFTTQNKTFIEFGENGTTKYIRRINGYNASN